MWIAFLYCWREKFAKKGLIRNCWQTVDCTQNSISYSTKTRNWTRLRFRKRPIKTMLLKDLLSSVEKYTLIGSDEPDVLGITLDSKKVQKGDLFAALPGADTHGLQF